MTEKPAAEKIVLDPDSGIAPYEQLRTQLSERARSGALPVGHRLPTVRGFAEELGLAANTVAKAYRALEADGVIETRGRNGTFVAAAGGAAEQKAATAAQLYAETAERLGLTRQQALALAKDAVRAAYRD
ncbi:GntR family transcriptional regulator [Streptomyces cyaneofuscatus]|uniref:GntR family transcriptional regulator n=1 Tax=Streptomyces cyaneofuscatus TaxID=66883 RepID=UPI002FF42817